jgi:hypothetical protein
MVNLRDLYGDDFEDMDELGATGTGIFSRGIFGKAQPKTSLFSGGIFGKAQPTIAPDRKATIQQMMRGYKPAFANVGKTLPVKPTVRRVKPTVRRIKRLSLPRLRRPLQQGCPAAYRMMAANAGIGGSAAMKLLEEIKALVELQNTRQLATHEHNVLKSTSAYRRAVLNKLQRLGRA